MRASMTSPHCTGTIGPKAPDSTVSPAFKRTAGAGHGAGQPPHGVEGIAQAGGADAGGQRLAPALQHHAAGADRGPSDGLGWLPST